MKFGIHYSLGVGFTPTGDDYCRVAQKAEELGYHSVWLGDHIVIPEKNSSSLPWYRRWVGGIPPPHPVA